MNSYGIFYDKAGFCALCHDPIAEFNGSDGKGNFVITKFLPNLRMSSVFLDDGSIMKVALCEHCEESFSPEDCGVLMESIINGWQWEVDNLCHHWPQEKKDNYMDRYSTRFITDRFDKPWTIEKLIQLSKPNKARLKGGGR